MDKIQSILIFAALAILAASCAGGQDASVPEPSGNGVYYWKTTFRLNDTEREFLNKNEIKRLYLRMFDVGIEENTYPRDAQALPIATVKFESAVPDSIEVVPTVFITLDALKSCEGKEEELAAKIVKRANAICSYNNVGEVKEVQFDCDWTESTRGIYERLCNAARSILHQTGAQLSGTIRLHQVEEATYPFDRGVLMLYNTGAIKDPQTGNSIISYSDVAKYLGVQSRIERFNNARNGNCPIIDFAYPTFCWGVAYREDGRFDGIVKALEFDKLDWLTRESSTRYVVTEPGFYENAWYSSGTYIRPEYSDISEILKVKDLVDKTIRSKSSSNIIYHLDGKNLSKYTDNEIEKILR